MPLDLVLVTVVCSSAVPRTRCSEPYLSDCQTLAKVRGRRGTETVGGSFRNWSRALESRVMPPLAPESTFAHTFFVPSSCIRFFAAPTDFQSG